MSRAKDTMIRIIQEQPEDSSFDEILRELAFTKMVDRGLADSDAGRVISYEEMEKWIKSWQE
ncbi:hypothetical protein HKBW3S03_00399 [Candidatus Hakubella thermalkaliphila]|uniref:Uncharacterized protein n=1 Tax=Candidatus Hakubella thermalkaliphila TaxID=2754717 RepID=A0A6V8Q3D9_9ACTN|nr:hypothetical protein [Candidatus Hakubella thermalkaliphila]MBT9170314.1 hypothetical protein [Actinomycetota bacterium]GFP18894.1 hypothetical protein HKBW3S03_00399 [Candidatus Hakubella thermalkaliphila]GFP20857.1 hypothetical protein HKBW3S06_00084 [Candidatus Hakubella thermalkaliphila]GFP39292.1 hypothetical protein HKBW3S47_00991 [Candidatus Hakubella thermalkaliphila]GFP40921.1 hypothetical protein HKBW3C_00046 [Candidatus Hakubella thermalkaliphila]